MTQLHHHASFPNGGPKLALYILQLGIVRRAWMCPCRECSDEKTIERALLVGTCECACACEADFALWPRTSILLGTSKEQ